MEYIENSTDETAGKAESGRIRRIHRKVCAIRKSEKAGVKYMQRWEELAYARQDGKAEGITQGKQESILDLLGEIGPIPTDMKEEIMAETDEETLKRWVRIAARAGSIDDFIKRR